jgi:hypothetical protein
VDRMSHWRPLIASNRHPGERILNAGRTPGCVGFVVQPGGRAESPRRAE